jgi:hypothetical protein
MRNWIRLTTARTISNCRLSMQAVYIRCEVILTLCALVWPKSRRELLRGGTTSDRRISAFKYWRRCSPIGMINGDCVIGSKLSQRIRPGWPKHGPFLCSSTFPKFLSLMRDLSPRKAI